VTTDSSRTASKIGTFGTKNEGFRPTSLKYANNSGRRIVPTTTDRIDMTQATHTETIARPRPIERTIPAENETGIVTTAGGRLALAILRVATGFIFLWAFLDKTFGLGYSTTRAHAWINGGTPSQGFLKSPAVVGPFKPFFAAIASPTTDVLFMIGMLAVGAAVILGIGLRISAVAGTIILLFMYLAEWSFGPNAASTNPVVDYHIIFALSLIVVAALSAGDAWGLGRSWKRLNVVQNHRWLI
jgi:thiosulfate dehydrogenase [quinone] large subunit